MDRRLDPDTNICWNKLRETYLPSLTLRGQAIDPKKEIEKPTRKLLKPEETKNRFLDFRSACCGDQSINSLGFSENAFSNHTLRHKILQKL